MSADGGDYCEMNGAGSYLELLTELDNTAGNDTVTPSSPAYEKLYHDNVHCVTKNQTATINMTKLHQFTTFVNYFWHRETLFNSEFTKLKVFKWLKISRVFSIATVAT